MKFLIAGLGNIGPEYENTRHNIGFKVLDTLVRESGTSFLTGETAFRAGRYGDVATLKHRGRIYILLKPSTYMNLSGKAVSYWMQQEKIPLDRLLVVTDDLALPFGTIRLRGKGSDGGHNGLKNINQILGTQQYARLRFGIGSEFGRGQQVNYVLSAWSEDEKAALPERCKQASNAILAFGTLGLAQTMTAFNNK
ncbi:MAG: aminoacyl-tRNA hydrolase [Cryomorphaceae bacterium]|nr:MAG: aminoacyl-tRNA hydrolase [Cryomorphaceae bacterium]